MPWRRATIWRTCWLRPFLMPQVRHSAKVLSTTRHVPASGVHPINTGLSPGRKRRRPTSHLSRGRRGLGEVQLQEVHNEHRLLVSTRSTKPASTSRDTKSNRTMGGFALWVRQATVSPLERERAPRPVHNEPIVDEMVLRVLPTRHRHPWGQQVEPGNALFSPSGRLDIGSALPRIAS